MKGLGRNAETWVDADPVWMVIASLAWLWGVEGLRPDRWDVAARSYAWPDPQSSSQDRADPQHEVARGVAKSSSMTH